MRLIDADAATLSTYNNPYWTESEAAGVRSFLLHQPTIDPETLRPTGRWVYDDGNLEWACSECLCAAHVNLGAISEYILSDFCPNCGAKMEG